MVVLAHWSDSESEYPYSPLNREPRRYRELPNRLLDSNDTFKGIMLVCCMALKLLGSASISPARWSMMKPNPSKQPINREIQAVKHRMPQSHLQFEQSYPT